MKNIIENAKSSITGMINRQKKRKEEKNMDKSDEENGLEEEFLENEFEEDNEFSEEFEEDNEEFGTEDFEDDGYDNSDEDITTNNSSNSFDFKKYKTAIIAGIGGLVVIGGGTIGYPYIINAMEKDSIPVKNASLNSNGFNKNNFKENPFDKDLTKKETKIIKKENNNILNKNERKKIVKNENKSDTSTANNKTEDSVDSILASLNIKKENSFKTKKETSKFNIHTNKKTSPIKITKKDESSKNIAKDILKKDAVVTDFIHTIGSNSEGIDPYTLNDESITKIKNYEKYLEEKMSAMDKVVGYYKKQKEFKESVEALEDLTGIESESSREKKMNSFLDKRVSQVKATNSKEIRELKSMIQSLKRELNKVQNNQTITHKQIIQEPKQYNYTSKKTFRKTVEPLINKKAEKQALYKAVGENMGKINIFELGGNLIIVSNKDGEETIYNKGDYFVDNFFVADISPSIITFKRGDNLHYFNVKQNIGISEDFIPVVIKTPQMNKEISSDLENAESKVFSKKRKSSIKKYKTRDERKKEKAISIFRK